MVLYANYMQYLEIDSLSLQPNFYYCSGSSANINMLVTMANALSVLKDVVCSKYM